MGNGKWGTGNGEPETGVWEQVYSGNPPVNSSKHTDTCNGWAGVFCNHSKNGTIWGNMRKCYGCKRELPAAVLPDD